MAAPEPDRNMLRAGAGRTMFDGAPSFTLGHRLHRAAWKLAWLLLARWTPPPLHRWRIFVANVFGARIDSSALLYSSARIWYPPNFSMAAQSVLGPGVECYSMGPIAIGPRAVVSQRAFLCTGTHDIHRPEFQIGAKAIVIEANAWVCAEAFVGPGVSIGEGAVLGARGVAFSDLEPWTVYVGNPAAIKGPRTRFAGD
jgi:putative colanic acid biosynthesis acetyltransferase WcaF